MPVTSVEWARKPCSRCKRLISEKHLILVQTTSIDGDRRNFNRFSLCPSCWKEVYNFTFPEGRLYGFDD